MSNDTIDKLVWVLIYTGMFVGGLGIWLMEHHLAVGWTMFVLGGCSVLAGVLLIWLRSRRS